MVTTGGERARVEPVSSLPGRLADTTDEEAEDGPFGCSLRDDEEAGRWCGWGERLGDLVRSIDEAAFDPTRLALVSR